jgi:hypothetical protein
VYKFQVPGRALTDVRIRHLLANFFPTNFNQDEKDGILACRVGNPNDDWS